MPLVESEFRSPHWLPGGHLQTLYPFFFRRLSLASEPVEIATPDGDRLVADWYPPPDRTAPLLLIAHGMEGNSQRPYVLGLAQAAQRQGFAVLAWNLRGCGRQDNLLPKSYYAGCSDDLNAVIEWGRAQHAGPVVLSGFSMGGNITLKWLGEAGDQAARLGVKAAATVAVPCDLMGCNTELEKPTNTLYRRRFVRDLRRRLRAKALRFPTEFDLRPLEDIRTVRQFDDHYTAPMHGFRDAAHYYSECSANGFLETIRVPTLMLNARNDPFLSGSCFPTQLAERHDWLWLEQPATGGHVGFYAANGYFWESERLAVFLRQQLATE
ncbi:MAG: alpha/beta fold hydrolase [Natronospirillum sp.]|uniref:YheT family hydrolase n=1 Tax=Natronospirillum sp. TaxID=2812955 RepID=UPI0025EC0DA1|nr:alpha/beta fold hydrolase [Natronospirillum sp.]MCH8550827.1 alpha/beta fold hydrolase [Natronospirillum sp.]